MAKCSFCNFETKYKSRLERHKKTKKHLRNVAKYNLNNPDDNPKETKFESNNKIFILHKLKNPMFKREY